MKYWHQFWKWIFHFGKTPVDPETFVHPDSGRPVLKHNDRFRTYEDQDIPASEVHGRRRLKGL